MGEKKMKEGGKPDERWNKRDTIVARLSHLSAPNFLINNIIEQLAENHSGLGIYPRGGNVFLASGNAYSPALIRHSSGIDDFYPTVFHRQFSKL